VKIRKNSWVKNKKVMNEQNIHELLRRYFDGATSLAEERELQRYFSGKDIPDPLKPYRHMFAFFAEERAVTPPARRSPARIITLNRAIITGVAAGIAILLMVGLPKTQPDMYAYFVDGQRVYNETAAMEAADDKLQLLAASLQKAQTGMAAFGKVQESSQSLHELDKISNTYRKIERELGSSN
jgi:hypothetical protein